MVIHGSPCFVADTLVLTKDGYKKIADIEVGDYVLTHENTYEKVINVFDNGKKDIVRLVTPNVDEIKTTPNHRFWVRTMYQTYPTKEDGKRTAKRNWKEPEWKEAKDLTKNDWIGYAVNQNSIIPEWNGVECTRGKSKYIKKELDMNDENLWYLVGRFLGDGWTRTRNDRAGNISSLVICCGKNKTEDFASKISDKYHYTLIHDRTTDKFQFCNRELSMFCEQFGHGAINKFIPGFVFDMPVNLIKSLLNGYFDSDGCYSDKTYKATSISRELIYGFVHLIAKVYNVPCSMHKTKRPETCVIEGRVVHQNDSYNLAFHKDEDISRRSAFYEDGYVWYPVRKVEVLSKQENIYDIEVENAHSFTANGLVCHNCQDYSLAGKGAGGNEGSGTRSSLMYESIRIIGEVMPKVVIWENVKNLLSPKHKHNYDEYLKRLEKLGYTNYYKVLNAKNYGIPQNRERIFTISILGEHKPFEFPAEIELTTKLVDLLEPDVPEDFYISQEKIDKLLSKEIYQKHPAVLKDGTVSAICSRDYKDPKCIVVGADTLAIKEATKKGYALAGGGMTQ